VHDFQQALQTLFQVISQAGEAQVAHLPPELSNLDQLKVLMDALPDYHADDEQPSYVLAIPCRPIVVGLSVLLPGLPNLAAVNWGALMTQSVDDADLTREVDWDSDILGGQT